MTPVRSVKLPKYKIKYYLGYALTINNYMFFLYVIKCQISHSVTDTVQKENI